MTTRQIEKVDPEMVAFEAALLRSIDQVQRGEYAKVHTPAMMVARRAGRPAGRPSGSVKGARRQPTTLRLDETILQRWRASGKGWQTRAASILAVHAP